MKRFYDKLNYFSNTEKIIWTVSVCLIVLSHIVFGGDLLNLLLRKIGWVKDGDLKLA